MLHKNYLWFNVRRRTIQELKNIGESKKIRTKLLYLDGRKRECGEQKNNHHT